MATGSNWRIIGFVLLELCTSQPNIDAKTNETRIVICCGNVMSHPVGTTVVADVRVLIWQ